MITEFFTQALTKQENPTVWRHVERKLERECWRMPQGQARPPCGGLLPIGAYWSLSRHDVYIYSIYR
jgi:hypothetical protein